MGVLNVAQVHPIEMQSGAAAHLFSPLMQLLAQEIGKGREENRADTMRPDTAKTLNQMLGISETVPTQEQTQGPTMPAQAPAPGAQGPTMPAQAPPMATVDKPNPDAFTTQNLTGFSRPEMASVSTMAMMPKTLDQILAHKVQGNEITPEEAMQMKFFGKGWKTVTAPDGTVKRVNAITGATGDTQSPIQSGTASDYGTFYKSEKAGGASDQQIAAAWLDRQKELMKARGAGFAEARIAPVAGEAGQPPEYKTIAEISQGNKEGKKSIPAQFSPEIKQQMTEAAQRGGATTANVNDAKNTYQNAMPTMLALRQKVAEKNLMPTGGIKSMEGFNQWAMDNMSDPDVAALYTKAGMMQEALSRALGSTQGGQYMLQFASHLLDPRYAPEAFGRVVNEHMATLNDKLRARRTFGNNPENEPTGMPNAKNPTPTNRPLPTF